MPVGEYAGVPLQDDDDTWRHGAVFLLRKPARSSVSVSLDGWLTTVVASQSWVIVSGPSEATDFDSTYQESLNAANRGLDYMSVRGQVDCAIRDAPDDCLVWWLDPASGGVVMRCRAIQTFGLTLSFTAEVKDKDGNVKSPPPPPPAVADDVFRFVRMCRTSDDLFDAYRNLFLAFESILSVIRPRRQVPAKQPRNRRWWCWHRGPAPSIAMQWESERTWFMDALDEAQKLVPLDGLTPSNVTNHKKWIYKWMYSAERSALMHAKRGSNYLLPHDAASRAELVDSLGRLWGYIADLIEKQFGVRGMRGGFSLHAVELGHKGVFKMYDPVVADDSGSVTIGAETFISPESNFVELQSTPPVADAEDPALWTVLAHCPIGDLAGLAAIQGFGQKRKDGSGIELISELIGPLTLGTSVQRLEWVRGLRHVSPTGPPRRFSS